jgi:Domain of unknown function (DUF4388)
MFLASTGHAAHLPGHREVVAVASELSPVAPAALEGALSDVGLATVLAIFDLERRSGIITLQNGEGGRSGKVMVRDGRAVTAAVHEGTERDDTEHTTVADVTEPLRGREALYELLDWRQGRFVFRPSFVDAADELHGTTSELLLDAARRLDEGEGGVWQTSAKISLGAAEANAPST